MNRMAHGLKWKPESAARMLRSRAFACLSRYQLCVVLHEHGAVTGVTKGHVKNRPFAHYVINTKNYWK